MGDRSRRTPAAGPRPRAWCATAAQPPAGPGPRRRPRPHTRGASRCGRGTSSRTRPHPRGSAGSRRRADGHGSTGATTRPRETAPGPVGPRTPAHATAAPAPPRRAVGPRPRQGVVQFHNHEAVFSYLRLPHGMMRRNGFVTRPRLGAPGSEPRPSQTLFRPFRVCRRDKHVQVGEAGLGNAVELPGKGETLEPDRGDGRLVKGRRQPHLTVTQQQGSCRLVPRSCCHRVRKATGGRGPWPPGASSPRRLFASSHATPWRGPPPRVCPSPRPG